jgi:hypothetical protein
LTSITSVVAKGCVLINTGSTVCILINVYFVPKRSAFLKGEMIVFQVAEIDKIIPARFLNTVYNFYFVSHEAFESFLKNQQCEA